MRNVRLPGNTGPTFRAFGKRWSVWVLLLAVAFVIVLCALVITIASMLLNPNLSSSPNPTAQMTIIPAPTSTPRAEDLSPTGSAPTASSLIVGGIGVGMYVQINGTEGDGLRLRASPGTDADPRFLGREAEVFQVKDGPRDASGYTWWYLVAPYDANRSGWAVANFLKVVTEPTAGPTPAP